MSSPIQLSGLDPIPAPVQDADIMLVRRDNTTDYQATAQQVRNINMSGLPTLPASEQPTDLMMISQGGTNCKINFSQVGFIPGTSCWFYNNTAPAYWEPIPGTGDKLLAVQGGSMYTTTANEGGTWQQDDWTLTIDQIPSHTHDLVKRATGIPAISVVFGNDASSPPAFIQTASTGGSQPHNHGNTYRPLSNVGLLCQKMF